MRSRIIAKLFTSARVFSNLYSFFGLQKFEQNLWVLRSTSIRGSVHPSICVRPSVELLIFGGFVCFRAPRRVASIGSCFIASSHPLSDHIVVRASVQKASKRPGPASGGSPNWSSQWRSLLAIESHDRGSKRTEQASERTDLATESPRSESTMKRLQPCYETNTQISFVFYMTLSPLRPQPRKRKSAPLKQPLTKASLFGQ